MLLLSAAPARAIPPPPPSAFETVSQNLAMFRTETLLGLPRVEDRVTLRLRGRVLKISVVV